MADNDSIEDIYRLTDPQEAILLHRLQHPDADSGVIQFRGRLTGALDLEKFRAAWRATLARHPVLRGAVHWEDLKHPVVVVARHAEIEIESEDWRAVAPDRLSDELEEFYQANRRRGLALNPAPVMRLTLLHLADQLVQFVWACHHVLLDGWSSGLVLREVLERYHADLAGRRFEAPPAPTFRTFLSWLREQDLPETAAFWKSRALTPRLLLPPPVGQGPTSPPSRFRREVASCSSPVLEAWTQTNRVPASCLFAGCWALLLSEQIRTERPICGMTVSGRSAPVPGIQSMVGMFANTVPLLLEVEPEMSPGDWFRHVLSCQQQVQAFEHSSLGRVMEWSGASSRRPLFDTLLVFANYPVPEAAPDGGLQVSGLKSDLTSTYPLTVAVVPGPNLRLEVCFHPSRISAAQVHFLLDRYLALLQTALSGAAKTLGEFFLDPAPSTPFQNRVAALPDRREPAPVQPSRRPQYGPNANKPADTQLEALLAAIWTKLLGVRNLTRNDHFFDLGGTSLQVLEMIERIKKEFKIELPIGAIFQAPTLKGLAELIESAETAPTWRSLVEIREGSQRPPLFLVHHIRGTVTPFYRLANYLDPAQPIYGLQSPATPFAEMMPMASHYLSEVRELQPKGPYLLGGFCIGGCIAFEMARQLEAAGETVRFLALIDSLPPQYAFTKIAPLPNRLAREYRRLTSHHPRQLLEKLVKRAFTTVKRITGGGARQEAGGGSLTNGNGHPPDEFEIWLTGQDIPADFRQEGPFQVENARHFCALRDYQPQIFSGDAWILRTKDDRLGADLGWGPLVKGNLNIDVLPGHHVDLVQEPRVQELGKRMNEILASLPSPTAAP